MGKVTGGLESDLCPTTEQPVSDSVQVTCQQERGAGISRVLWNDDNAIQEDYILILSQKFHLPNTFSVFKACGPALQHSNQNVAGEAISHSISPASEVSQRRIIPGRPIVA